MSNSGSGRTPIHHVAIAIADGYQGNYHDIFNTMLDGARAKNIPALSSRDSINNSPLSLIKKSANSGEDRSKILLKRITRLLRSTALGQFQKVLNEAHKDIKSICENIGLDITAAQHFSDKTEIPLPWDINAAPKACHERAKAVLSKVKMSYDQGGEPAKYSAEYCGIMGALTCLISKKVSPNVKMAFLTAEQLLPVTSCIEHINQAEQDAAASWPSEGENDAIQATLCWIVHDVVASNALLAALPDTLKRILPGSNKVYLALSDSLHAIGSHGVHGLGEAIYVTLKDRISEQARTKVVNQSEYTLISLKEKLSSIWKDFDDDSLNGQIRHLLYELSPHITSLSLPFRSELRLSFKNILKIRN
jgi:hypothetical protein